MDVQSTTLPGVLFQTPRHFADDRGWVNETRNARIVADAGLDLPCVQDIRAFSAHEGKLRGAPDRGVAIHVAHPRRCVDPSDVILSDKAAHAPRLVGRVSPDTV